MALILSSALETISVIATVLYILGICCLIIEIFIPGFGFFGITGLSLVGVSIVTKVICGANVEKILLQILICFCVIIALLVWIIISAKKGLISKSPLISSGTAIPTFYSDDNLKVYISENGETLTTCRPVGKIRLGEEIFDAKCEDGYLKVGEKITVVNVKDNMLIIRKSKENDLTEVKEDIIEENRKNKGDEE